MSRVNVGKLKTWQQRLNTYMGLFNFGMLFYLFIVENRWFDWYVWVLVIGVGTFLLMLFDVFLVMPQQLEYNSNKNPEWKRHVSQMDRIERNQEMILGALNETM